MDATRLAPFVQPLPVARRVALGAAPRQIEVAEASHRFHPALPEPTTVWAYGPVADALGRVPPLVLEAISRAPARVRWHNDLPAGAVRPFVDLGLQMAMTGQAGMAPYATDSTVVHLHGARVPWTSDGHPVRVPRVCTILAPGESVVYEYPNDQPGATMWFHDHVMGSTTANVYAGLAGIYLLRSAGPDGPDEATLGIPVADEHEVPILLSDRTFAADGRVIYGATFGDPDPAGDRPLSADQAPEFKGDTIVVNGAVWPYLEVERTLYRFRVVNGATSRFFRLLLRTDLTPGPPSTTADLVADVTTTHRIVQIGGDGGFLPVPYATDDPGGPDAILLAPGERADLLVDFAAFAEGTRLLLTNEVSSESDNPHGEWPAFTTSLEGNGGDLTVTVSGAGAVTDPLPAAWVMQLRVGATPSAPRAMPSLDFGGWPEIGGGLDALRQDAAAVTAPRRFRLSEVDQGQEPAQPQIQSTTWLGWYAPRHGQAVDQVRQDAVEVWELTNVSPDTHPIHLHLVRFLVLSRENVDGTPACRPGGAPDGVDSGERGWKDTLRVGTGQRTRFAVRFDGYAGRYVWHCHILEHEDMGMMRPLLVVPPPP